MLADKVEQFFIDRYEDWDGKEQFKGTGLRLERMIEEKCWTKSKIEEEVKKCFKPEAVFEDSYNEMLISGPTSVWTFCPHHLLSCHFQVHIGYIPDKKILGLSKFSRIAIILSQWPIIQEQYTREVADVIVAGLSPKGVGVHVVGTHGCMSCRGVSQANIQVVTNVLRGYLLNDSSAKQEFLDSVR